MTNKMYKYITDLGQELNKGVRDTIEDIGLTAWVNGIGPLGYIFFTEAQPVDYRTASVTDLDKTWEFWFNMVNNGVLPWGPIHFEQWYMSIAHTKEDVAKTIETSREALRKVKTK